MMASPDELVYVAHKISLHLPRTDCGPWSRVRMAVTVEEYEAIREYCLKRDGKFWARLRNIPLVVDDNPENPLLPFEQARQGDK